MPPPPPPPAAGPPMKRVAIQPCALEGGPPLVQFVSPSTPATPPVASKSSTAGEPSRSHTIQVASMKAATLDLLWESDVIRRIFRSNGFEVSRLVVSGSSSSSPSFSCAPGGSSATILPDEVRVVWSRRVPEDIYVQLRPWQRVNHIPGRHRIGHKDSLGMLMRQAATAFPDAFNFVPRTFVLPLHAAEFRAAAQQQERRATKSAEQPFQTADGNIWISKPPASSQGRGIEVFRGTHSRVQDCIEFAAAVVQSANTNCTDTDSSGKSSGGNKTVDQVKSQIEIDEGMVMQGQGERSCSSAANEKVAAPDSPGDPVAGLVVQEYIKDPYLIRGLKFDLRVYVLVATGVIGDERTEDDASPLCCFVYNDGIVKFCSSEFSLDDETLGESFRHLANYALNKHNETFDESVEEGEGHRWTQKALFAYIDEHHGVGTAETVRASIDNVVAKLLISTYGHFRAESRRVGLKDPRRCFELLGLDVELDSELRPWLLEVNVCPSLAASKTDTMSQTLLNNLLVDTLNLVGVDATIGRCAPNNDVFADLVEMYARRGAFRLAYPTVRNVDQLSAFYAVSEGDIDVCRAAQQAASRLAAQLGAT